MVESTAGLPEDPALYRIVGRSKVEILYVGETNNLRRRIAEHISVKKMLPRSHVVHYMLAGPAATWKDRRLVEKVHIGRHDPRLNGTAGGEGRCPLLIGAKAQQAVAPAASDSWLARLWRFRRVGNVAEQKQ
jgi:hypothetical protein